MCGEQVLRIARRLGLNGSPPRVRGTELNLDRDVFDARITPACAGNRRERLERLEYKKDHPRVCGEQMFRPLFKSLISGSPPRVRGTVYSSSAHAPGFRITPACAGNRNFMILLRLLSLDHPRVCGEQTDTPADWLQCEGSPPRVRGTDKGCRVVMNELGITPACAGNRNRRRLKLRGEEDHPRVCGEQRGGRADRCPGYGSPPRVRGTGGASASVCSGLGITPACAGNSKIDLNFHGFLRDHPRVCGEQVPRQNILLRLHGSPPRVRGTD